MTARINAGLALLLAAGVLAVGFFMFREYRRGNLFSDSGYGQLIKGRDISDSASLAISILQDAEINAQDYALTGETTYLEAYSADIRDWQDAFGTLGLLARTDKGSKGLAADFADKATQVLDELALIVSIRDKDTPAAALERIRKGSAIVYLEQARRIASEIVTSGNTDTSVGSRRVLTVGTTTRQRLAAGGAAIFVLMLLGVVLAVIDGRRSRASRGS